MSPSRLYSTSCGAFIQRDPLLMVVVLRKLGVYEKSIFSRGINNFQYADFDNLYGTFNNNPNNFIDSSGLYSDIFHPNPAIREKIIDASKSPDPQKPRPEPQQPQQGEGNVKAGVSPIAALAVILAREAAKRAAAAAVGAVAVPEPVSTALGLAVLAGLAALSLSGDSRQVISGEECPEEEKEETPTPTPKPIIPPTELCANHSKYKKLDLCEDLEAQGWKFKSKNQAANRQFGRPNKIESDSRFEQVALTEEKWGSGARHFSIKVQSPKKWRTIGSVVCKPCCIDTPQGPQKQERCFTN